MQLQYGFTFLDCPYISRRRTFSGRLEMPLAFTLHMMAHFRPWGGWLMPRFWYTQISWRVYQNTLAFSGRTTLGDNCCIMRVCHFPVDGATRQDTSTNIVLYQESLINKPQYRKWWPNHPSHRMNNLRIRHPSIYKIWLQLRIWLKIICLHQESP